jgi:hypothetical protein
MPYSGSCHCGAVAFTVAAEPPGEALSCNCSICRRKSLLLTFVPEAAFTLEQGEDALQSYRFNKHEIEHQFCKICGVQAFARGRKPDGSGVRAVNLRCIPGIDLKALTINEFDGAAS